MLGSYNQFTNANTENEKFQIFHAAFSDPVICEILGTKLPHIEDWSNLIDNKNLAGTLNVVRMDGTDGEGNLKDPIVAGLFLLHILKGVITLKTKGLMDAGNVNSGVALGKLAARFGLRVHYVMSRFFPPDVIDYVKEYGVRVEIAPVNEKLSIEEEFYKFALIRHRQLYPRRQFCGLWHAKNGHLVAKSLGLQLQLKYFQPQNKLISFVTMVGSGASFVLFNQISDERARLRGEKLCPEKITVPEHISSKKLWLGLPNVDLDIPQSADLFDLIGTSSVLRLSNRQEIKHAILGPHHQFRNPYFGNANDESIEKIVWIDDRKLDAMVRFLLSLDISVGSSSAANLLVAKSIAERGGHSVTFVFEKLRPYYLNNQFSDVV